MQERFTNLFRLPENLYSAGSPLLIAAGALLKDNQTGKVLAQLKLKSISDKPVKAVKVAVDAFDVSGKPVEGVAEYQYLDLSEKRDAEFGQKSAIFLPDNTARSFAARILTVVYADNSSWTWDGGAAWDALPKQRKAGEALGDSGLARQYALETKVNDPYSPLEERGVWLCACGAANRAGEEKCHVCGNSLAELKAKLSDPSLAQRKDARLEQERATAERKASERTARAEETRRAQEAKRRKGKRLAAILIPAIVVIIAAVIVLVSVVIPTGKYNDALAMAEDGQYDAAIAAFTELGDYKDSAQQIEDIHQQLLASQYEEGLSLLAAGEYDKAIGIFEELGAYRDAGGQIQEAYYQKAASLILSGNYDKAEDAIRLAKAQDGAEEEAVAVDLSQIPGGYFIECDNEYVLGAYYERAQQLYAAGDYENALVAFCRAGDYEDSAGMLYRCTFKAAKAGDLLTFGAYHGAPVEWVVVDSADGKLMLVSAAILDYQQWDDGLGGVYATWADASLRNWLNGEFLSAAFSEEEQAMLIPTELTQGDIYLSITKAPPYELTDKLADGFAVSDKVFLLNRSEILKYQDVYLQVDLAVSDYAVTQYPAKYSDYYMLNWWTRENALFFTPEQKIEYDTNTTNDIMVVGNEFFKEGSFGVWAPEGITGVRPAVWIDTDLVP